MDELSEWLDSQFSVTHTRKISQNREYKFKVFAGLPNWRTYETAALDLEREKINDFNKKRLDELKLADFCADAVADRLFSVNHRSAESVSTLPIPDRQQEKVATFLAEKVREDEGDVARRARNDVARGRVG